MAATLAAVDHSASARVDWFNVCCTGADWAPTVHDLLLTALLWLLSHTAVAFLRAQHGMWHHAVTSMLWEHDVPVKLLQVISYHSHILPT